MNRTSVIDGSECTFVVLTLCSYGDRGDFQVLPRTALDLDLEAIRDGLAGRNHRAAIDGDRLLAEIDGCSVLLYSQGRAVLEGVRPDSEDAAWTLLIDGIRPRLARPPR
jgi:hypothetical protein